MDALTPELLEKMRAIGVRLDRSGVFWHDGAAVTHTRLRQAMLRWLDVREDGRDIIRIDDKRYAYVDIEDAHLRALSAWWDDDDRCQILWDDDRQSELDYAHLTQAEDHALYTRVRERLRGRIAGAAYYVLAERVVEEASGAFWLTAAGKRWPIPGAR